jgi:AcrR family transcriptional regulator
MADIAAAAKLSRQAVYLHFSDRAELMIALVRFADEQRNLAQEIHKVTDAPSGAAALLETAALQARMNPGIWAAARAVDAVRRLDPAAERSWQDRLAHRLAGAREIVSRLRAENNLRPNLDSDAAADLLWSITSLRMWEDLVLERGWTAAQYEARITELLLISLTRKSRV